MTKIKLTTLLTLLMCVSKWAAGAISPNAFNLVSRSPASISTIEIKQKSGSIRCPSGEDIAVPSGTRLELSDYKIGNKAIVKVPESLSAVCRYGILKYKEESVVGSSPAPSPKVAPSPKGGKRQDRNRVAHKKIQGVKNVRMVKSNKTKKTLIAQSVKTQKTKKTNKKIRRIAQVANKMQYADRCKDEFIGTEGIGDWGKYVKNELSSGQYQSLLKNSKAFRNVCPGFPYMSVEEKKTLWVFILMSMSHYESSCRPQVEAQGPNGIAKGLLQLHEGAENKYTHWDQNRLCRKGDSKNPKESLQCTLSMLNGQVERFNSIFFEKSYWDVLRNVNTPTTHASKIKKAIRMLSGCEFRSVASNQRTSSRYSANNKNAKNTKEL